MMSSGTKVATSRGVRSCNFSFFGLVTGPKNTRWYSHKRYAAASKTPGTAHAVQNQPGWPAMSFCRNVPARMVNQQTKPLSRGSPMEDEDKVVVVVAWDGNGCQRHASPD